MKDILEILIPTYNRKTHIKRTLSQLIAKDSPVRECKITVLDNASTDGTSAVIEDFASRYTNIKHIRHLKNIGGNANITRAYELAKKPYVWVVCDDDSFRWDAWSEIENALRTDDYDLLLTRKAELRNTSDIARIFKQCTFVPACIYKTSIITDGVIMNMYNNVLFLFPHLALFCAVLNKKGRIFLPQGEIMDICTYDPANTGDGNYNRGNNTYIPDCSKNMFWTVGFIFSAQMIEDKKLRTYVLDHIGGHGFCAYIIAAFRKNYKFYGGSRLNEQLVRSGLCFRHRVEFDIARVFLKTIYLFSRKKHK